MLYRIDLIKDALDKVKLIQDRLSQLIPDSRVSQIMKVRDLSFMVGKKVLLKVSPIKGIMRFMRRGKLSPRFTGPFEVLERVSEATYWIALTPSLSRVHLVFHVSMLRKYHVDRSHVLYYRTI